MVSHYDCEKQHKLRQLNLSNVKPCTEAPSNIQHAKVRARGFVRAKAKRGKAFNCEAYAKKERKICFQGSDKYRRVDRTVWKNNTLPLPITLDPLECKNLIRHLNGANNQIINTFSYNLTFTLLLILSPTCQQIKLGLMTERPIHFTIVYHIINLK